MDPVVSSPCSPRRRTLMPTRATHLHHARRLGTALWVLTLMILLVAWGRSLFVAEEYSFGRQFVSWPGGLEMKVRLGSSKPGDWLLDGQPCVQHLRKGSISSGYGRLIIWFAREESKRPRPSLSLGTERIRPPSTPVDHDYSSKRLDPWTLFEGPRWSSLSNEVTHLHFLGASIRRGFSKTLFETSEECRITIPYWMPTSLFFIPLACQPFRRKKRRAGHCPRCNYDLRASQDRCPECGHPIPQPQNPPPTPPPAAADPPQ